MTSTRFRGFSAEVPRFFETLAADPCPDGWPADIRVRYAAHVLSPLKALVTDLERRLSDVSTLVALEARVGASLSWPRGRSSGPDDCPVSRVRAWARGWDPESSPLLYADLGASGIEIGLTAGDEDLGVIADRVPGGWTVSADRLTRIEPWEDWIEEPGFASELEARFRELLPLFERIIERATETAPRPATLPDA